MAICIYVLSNMYFSPQRNLIMVFSVTADCMFEPIQLQVSIFKLHVDLSIDFLIAIAEGKKQYWAPMYLQGEWHSTNKVMLVIFIIGFGMSKYNRKATSLHVSTIRCYKLWLCIHAYTLTLPIGEEITVKQGPYSKIHCDCD